jgi:asparaginyl-tRNA synthetase
MHRVILKTLCVTLSRRAHTQTLPIKALLNANDTLIDKDVQISGWIRFIRLQKENTFIHINDGSECKNLQLVVTRKNLCEHDQLALYETVLKKLFFGTAIQATGTLVKSTHKQQSVEIRIKDIKVIGPCDPAKYPFGLKEKLDLEKIRKYPHLRANLSPYASLLRFRSCLTSRLHGLFSENRFVQVHTPIITQTVCEDSCEAFELTPVNRKQVGDPFFAAPAYLTSSAQLHLETMVNSLGRVYTISPTFRAERSLTRHHLSEFYMIEAELINVDTLDGLLDVVEMLVKHICSTVYDGFMATDLDNLKQFFNGQISLDEHIERIKRLGNKQFARIQYAKAIGLLNDITDDQLEKLSFGDDLGKQHETQLVKCFDGMPVFVTHYPRSFKPFYMRVSDDDARVVENFDLLVDDVGELVGGSAREHRYDVLLESMKAQKLNIDNYRLYLETKEFGGMKMGGFGIGLDRLMQFLLRIDNIRDTCAFPRHINHCKM